MASARFPRREPQTSPFHQLEDLFSAEPPGNRDVRSIPQRTDTDPPPRGSKDRARHGDGVAKIRGNCVDEPWRDHGIERVRREGRVEAIREHQMEAIPDRLGSAKCPAGRRSLVLVDVGVALGHTGRASAHDHAGGRDEQGVDVERDRLGGTGDAVEVGCEPARAGAEYEGRADQPEPSTRSTAASVRAFSSSPDGGHPQSRNR